MLDSSLEFKQLIRENTKCTISANITFSNGITMELAGTDFMANTVSFDDSTSASGTFEIGAAIMNSFSCTLNNFNGKFNGYDFTDAVIAPVLKKELSSSTELIPKGTFYVEQPTSIGNTITITAYDKMKNFEKPYSGVGTLYPAALEKILNDVCTYCGVVLSTQHFENYDYVIPARPDDSTMTCLDIVSYAAQIAGCFARINVQGCLELSWYDLYAFDEEMTDGGTFKTVITPYSDGASLDGGDFTDYSTGDSVDGKLFTNYRPYLLYAFNSFQICTDDVVITGIKAVVDDSEYLYGSEGYVLSIENNAFVTAGNMKAVAKMVGDKIIGMRFRPFTVSVLSDPTLEAGDAVMLLKDGSIYYSYITHTSYKMGNWQTVECTAETPSANSAAKYSAVTQAYVKARNEVKKQITSYNLAVQQLTNLITNSFGVFKTEEVQEDGSIIYYLHNKPELSSSSTIWKMTADAFAVSTDGGQTWNAGMDADGNAVLNILDAVGINADWINAGTIRSIAMQNGENGEFLVDEDGNMTAENAYIKGKVESSEIVGSSINNGNGTFSVDADGTMTASNAKITGTIIGENGYSLEWYDHSKPPAGHEFVFAETYLKPGDTFPYLRMLSPSGNTIFECGLSLKTYAGTGKLYLDDSPVFPNGALIENACINTLQTTTTEDYALSNGSEGISFRVRASGAFVSLYGSYMATSHEAGRMKEIDIGVLDSGYLPTAASIRTVGAHGGTMFLFIVTSGGKFRARNMGTTDISTNTAISVDFRFDFFRF